MAKFRPSLAGIAPGAANLPLIAIVGRPNVGKSTLFNRLTGTRRSIVGDEPGITRDRIYGEYEWAGRQYRVVDTGGIVPDDPELMATEIYNQAKVALEEADALVFVVDVRTELASPDYDLARLLIRGGNACCDLLENGEHVLIGQRAFARDPGGQALAGEQLHGEVVEVAFGAAPITKVVHGA